MNINDFSDEDKWKGIILFGLNAATYKMALAKCLMEFSSDNRQNVSWDEIADAFLRQYEDRLGDNPMPQQGNPNRLTVMERIVKDLQLNLITRETAVSRVAENGLSDVVPRFQTIGRDRDLIGGHFYEFDFGERLVLKDSMLELGNRADLVEEFMARWSLLEGAFSINQEQFALSNDIREIYLKNGYERKPLTSNIPFLSGYQGNTCFYCGEPLGADVHVDHLLPRQVVHHDEMWNLVLAHGDCNLLKSDHLVGSHFLQKLVARNENIMGSNHPWKHKISSALGKTPRQRETSLNNHYENVKAVLGNSYWGGSESYNPITDPFYRRLITVLNNSQQ